MNNFIERTWVMIAIGDEIKKLMKTYVQFPPRKAQVIPARLRFRSMSGYRAFALLAKQGIHTALDAPWEYVTEAAIGVLYMVSAKIRSGLYVRDSGLAGLADHARRCR